MNALNNGSVSGQSFVEYSDMFHTFTPLTHEICGAYCKITPVRVHQAIFQSMMADNRRNVPELF